MGNQPCALDSKEIDAIKDETGFTVKQIKRIYGRFEKLDVNLNGFLSHEDFRRIDALHYNPLRDQIINAFFSHSTDGRLSFRQFINVIACFRPVEKDKETIFNSREGKLRFVYEIFGASNEKPISKREILTILELMLGEDIAEDKVNSIAERIIFEADKSGQGKISFEDFCIALERTDVKHKMSIRYLG